MYFGFTEYAAKKALDLMLNMAAWSAPTLRLGVATADPGWAGSLANESALARVALSVNLGSNILATGETFLAAITAMPMATTTFTATHGFAADAASAGNMIFKGRLVDALNRRDGIGQASGALPITFNVFDISFQMDDHDDATAVGFTNYGRQQLMDHACGKLSHTPGTRYLGIFADDPGQAGTLTSELSGLSYARVSLAGKIDLAESDGQQAVATSNADIVFPTASGAWAEAAFFGLLDASTSGNMIWRCPHRRAISVASGDAFTIPAGQLAFRLK